MEKYIEIDYGLIDLTFNKDMVCCVRANRYWDHFLTHLETRDTLRKICIEFAKYFREEKIVYLPDHFGLDYVFSDMDLNNILESLESRLGKDAPSIESIYKEFDEHVESDGYYIERL
ncbi:hypothetical protein [Paenibacillus sp. Leaf72]|uniref:hypothetical protein n=1 Tax=Paenibacillus sp. Leaf72 TaxID=1736234 RepID=UPI0012DF547D|nr:hypothetical protein [Paenibacillus sp. Leaf72]